MKPFEVFRTGTHIASNGRKVVMTASMLAAIANNFNAELAGAPFVIGHPQADAPAYGWVDKLSVKNDRLIVHPKKTEIQFSEMVKDGRFPSRSVSLYGPDDNNNPVPGSYYVRHIGFLGAAAPAIQGLKPVEFSASDDLFEFTVVSEPAPEWTRPIDALARGLASILASLDFSVPSVSGAPANALSNDYIKPKEDIMKKTKKQTPDDFAAKLAALDARAAELDARELEFAQAASAQRAEADAALIEGLEADGKIPPSAKAGLLDFMATLDDADESAFNFAQADGKTAEITPHAFFSDLLSSANAQIDFSEASSEEHGEGIDNEDATDIAVRALDFQQKQAASGVVIGMSAAVEHVSKTA